MSDDFANLAQFNFGEKLVELIFSKLVASKAEIPFYEFYENHVGRETGEQFSEDFLFKAEVPLKINRGGDIINFDDQSKIDVLAYTGESSSFAIEVKLGNSGGAKSFPSTFLSHWKNNESSSLELNSEAHGMTVKGNMIHILDSNKIIQSGGDVCDFSAELKNEKDEVVLSKIVSRDWWLVIRKDSLLSNFKKLPSRSTGKIQSSFEHLSRLFILENLWALISDEERKLIVNELSDLMRVQFKVLNDKFPFIAPKI